VETSPPRILDINYSLNNEKRYEINIHKKKIAFHQFLTLFKIACFPYAWRCRNDTF
jgi:hypothetical protein